MQTKWPLLDSFSVCWFHWISAKVLPLRHAMNSLPTSSSSRLPRLICSNFCSGDIGNETYFTAEVIWYCSGWLCQPSAPRANVMIIVSNNKITMRFGEAWISVMTVEEMRWFFFLITASPLAVCVSTWLHVCERWRGVYPVTSAWWCCVCLSVFNLCNLMSGHCRTAHSL